MKAQPPLWIRPLSIVAGGALQRVRGRWQPQTTKARVSDGGDAEHHPVGPVAAAAAGEVRSDLAARLPSVCQVVRHRRHLSRSGGGYAAST